MTTLRTHVEAFIDEVWEPDKGHLLILHEEINHLEQLIQNLREVSKLEETELILNKSYFNISNEIQKIVQSFIPLFKKDNYEINFKIEPDISVLMDKDKYRQIMYNLISNAHNFLNKNGKISVDLSKQANNIIIHIEDNGIGISKNDLPHIFERYFRSKTSINKQTKGSGLGLSIVKSLVETHNGTINVKSTLGKGTIFTIVFRLE
ncbi:Histidine kinase-, DNA gyrase B-, and HSP90-like ATPase [Sporanaerobacter acetigenes DSM 13106]|uniref:histidine kinase n=1 Tax=Sporanaerobacter acetigenes DSM 13106 TaxID=1123281 RepID=A0A1M5WR16_9FIRM|nr:Histidine kinase-, DNA gyrase B-, and HSP90-like ATPase [Sporanaerobacter acetigenes DSM 13106]